MRKYLLGSLSVLLLITVWYIFSSVVNNSFILPNPIIVFDTLLKLLTNFSTYSTIGITIFRLIAAFIISAFLGVFLGLLAGNYSWLDEFLHPLVTTLRTLPVASIIIIIIILFGNQSSLYLITFLMIFPIIYEASKSGVNNIPLDLKNNIALETHQRFVIMIKIQLPLSLPYIKTALFQSIGLGFKVIVMAEFISQTTKGIGYELFRGTTVIQYELVFAWTIIIIVIVMIFEIMIKKLKRII
jgi:NitT/TauT family transport system permease protein